jgi:hypothetical protein
MVLETERSHSIVEMAKNARSFIKNRSINGIIHKLNELISQEDFSADSIDLEGEVFPAQVVSGYIILTRADQTKIPAHHYVWSKHYGDIPKGYHIHHRNGKRIDNRIENLSLMSSDDHIAYHKGGRLPETEALFYFLSSKGMWLEYLNFREQFFQEQKYG